MLARDARRVGRRKMSKLVDIGSHTVCAYTGDVLSVRCVGCHRGHSRRPWIKKQASNVAVVVVPYVSHMKCDVNCEESETPPRWCLS